MISLRLHYDFPYHSVATCSVFSIRLTFTSHLNLNHFAYLPICDIVVVSILKAFILYTPVWTILSTGLLYRTISILVISQVKGYLHNLFQALECLSVAFDYLFWLSYPKANCLEPEISLKSGIYFYGCFDLFQLHFDFAFSCYKALYFFFWGFMNDHWLLKIKSPYPMKL